MTQTPVTVARRSMLLGGFRLMVTRPSALVWTYLASLSLAVLFSLGLHAKLSDILDHSFAAERLNSAFDLGVLGALVTRLNYRTPSQGAGLYAGLPIYFLIYFLLVPGALLAYRLGSSAGLGQLLRSGTCFFWRFVRITLMTLVVFALVLGPLIALQTAWAAHVDEHVVGWPALYQTLLGWLLVLLVASLLRLYFDLVEVYTVQLDAHYRPTGKPDRRVRKTLLPAVKVLWRNLPRALGSFVLIAVVGLAVLFVTGRTAVHTLAQPRVWPAFLLLQAGLFINLATRYWQRGAGTILAADNPLASPLFQNEPLAHTHFEPNCSGLVAARSSATIPAHVPEPFAYSSQEHVRDAQPAPEPAPPSLRNPDKGVFHVPPALDPSVS